MKNTILIRSTFAVLFAGSGLALSATNVEAQTPKPKPATKTSRTLTSKGVVHSVRDGQLLFQTSLSLEAAQKLSKVGFTRISSLKKAGDRTIYKDRLFVSYAIDSRRTSERELKKHIGKRVELSFVRGENGRVSVTAVKSR